jgi:hypothetical protein
VCEHHSLPRALAASHVHRLLTALSSSSCEQAASIVASRLSTAGIPAEEVLVLAPTASIASAVCRQVEATVPFTRSFGVAEASVSRLATDIVLQYGHLFGMNVMAEDATGTQLSVEFESHLHLLPLIAFRPPNHPTKFSSALLHHFSVLNVRQCLCRYLVPHNANRRVSLRGRRQWIVRGSPSGSFSSRFAIPAPVCTTELRCE